MPPTPRGWGRWVVSAGVVVGRGRGGRRGGREGVEAGEERKAVGEVAPGCWQSMMGIPNGSGGSPGSYSAPRGWVSCPVSNPSYQGFRGMEFPSPHCHCRKILGGREGEGGR